MSEKQKTVKEKMREWKAARVRAREGAEDLSAENSRHLTEALDHCFDWETMMETLEELRTAMTRRYDKDGNMISESIDVAARREFLRFNAEYKVGRPIERKQVVTAKVDGIGDLRELLMGSKEAREAFVELLSDLPADVRKKLMG